MEAMMSEVQEVPGGFDEPGAATAATAGGAGNFALPSFGRALSKSAGAGGPIEMLKDVELNVKIELGRTRMLIEDVLRLAEGSVVELDKLAGDPVDVYVNDQLVARGEVLVLNDNFCVRVNEIVTTVEE
jgi:flagellar motor switch protein FliN